MKRRNFLKAVVGFVAGLFALAIPAKAKVGKIGPPRWVSLGPAWRYIKGPTVTEDLITGDRRTEATIAANGTPPIQHLPIPYLLTPVLPGYRRVETSVDFAPIFDGPVFCENRMHYVFIDRKIRQV